MDEPKRVDEPKRDSSTHTTQEMLPILLEVLPRFEEIGHGFSMYNALRDMHGMDTYGGDMSNPPRRAGFYLQAKKAELGAMNNALAGGRAPDDIAGEIGRWIAQAQAVEAAWFKSGSSELSFRERGLQERLPVTREELEQYGEIHHALTREVRNLSDRGYVKIEGRLIQGGDAQAVNADLATFMGIMDRKFTGGTITDDERAMLETLARKY